MLNAIPQITQLVIDHRYREEDLFWSSKERPVPRSVRPSECKHLNTYWSFFNQDIEATEMPWDHQATTTASRDPLVPNLTSFTAIIKIGIGNRDEFAVYLLEFLKSRIHPHPASSAPSLSTAPDHPTASLESVTLVLDGHPEMQTDTEVDIPLDLAAEVARHVELVGRKIGEDIFLDISYPWKELYEHEGKQKWKAPDILLSLKAGLDEETDYTWPFG
ncbi:hypothetical protein BJ165DRAFT_1501132, partial [Panaeolus papilionaceus]